MLLLKYLAGPLDGREAGLGVPGREILKAYGACKPALLDLGEQIAEVNLSGPRLLSRAGDGIDVPAGKLARIPYGHPEGYYVAIANIYRSVIDTILKIRNGETPTPEDLDFPNVDDGVSGVKFFHAVVESAQNNSKWVELD